MGRRKPTLLCHLRPFWPVCPRSASRFLLHPVVDHQLGAWFAVGSQHGGFDVNILKAFVRFDECPDQSIGLAHFLNELPALDARLDRDEDNSRVGQSAVDRLDEGLAFLFERSVRFG